MRPRAFSVLSVLVLALALSPLASAEVFAKFDQPMGRSTIFESEVVQLELIVLNDGNSAARNISMSAYSDSGLSLVLEDGRQARRIDFAVSELKPGQREKREVQVLGVKTLAGPQKVYLDYNDSGVPHSSSLLLSVIKSPFAFSARLSKDSIAPGESSSVVVSLKNSSQEEVSDVQIYLLAPPGINAGSKISVPRLGIGESILDRELSFESSREASGTHPVVARASFFNSVETHLFQKQLSLNVGANFPITLAVLIVLFVFVLGAFVFSGKRRRKEEPAAKEEAGEEGPAPEPKPKPAPKAKPKEKAKQKEKKK